MESFAGLNNKPFRRGLRRLNGFKKFRVDEDIFYSSSANRQASVVNLWDDLAISSSPSQAESPPETDPNTLGIEQQVTNNCQQIDISTDQYPSNIDNQEDSNGYKDHGDDTDDVAPAAPKKVFNLKFCEVIIRRINLRKLQCKLCSKIFSSDVACRKHLQLFHTIGAHKDLPENDNVNNDQDDDDGYDDIDDDDNDHFYRKDPRKIMVPPKTNKISNNMRPGTSSNLSASLPSGVENLECVFCASRYQSMKDLVFHLAATHKIDRSKTSSSAGNQQSRAIRIENIPKKKLEQVQGFRIRNGANSRWFEVRFPVVSKKQLSKEDDEKPSGSSRAPKVTKSKVSSLPSTSRRTASKGRKSRDKPYDCKKCDKKYTAKSSLTRHMDTHSGRFPCRHCEKTFTTHEGMTVHSKRFHSGDRTVRCRFCPHQLTKSKTAMTTHEMSKHFEEWYALQRVVNENENVPNPNDTEALENENVPNPNDTEALENENVPNPNDTEALEIENEENSDDTEALETENEENSDESETLESQNEENSDDE